MMAITHTVTGVLAYTAIASTTGLALTAGGVGGAFAGSVLPDIDHPKSWLGRRMWPVSYPLSKIVGHRGITHSLLAVVLCVALLIWFGLDQFVIVSALSIGYLVHLSEDFLSNSGVPLLWPMQRRFSIPLVNTGGITEAMFLVASLAGFGYAFSDQLEPAVAAVQRLIGL